MEHGTSVVIMRRRTSPTQRHQARLVAERDAVLGLEVTTADWVAGEELLLLTGELGHFTVADARYVSTRAGVGIVKVVSTWRPFDSRERTRFSTSIDVMVRAPGRAATQPGIVSDVSNGGMAVRVNHFPEQDSVEILIEDARFSNVLPCRVTSTHHEGADTVLHLAFL